MNLQLETHQNADATDFPEVSESAVVTTVFKPELFCLDIDLTERKAAETELERDHHHLEEMVGQRTVELMQARDDAEPPTAPRVPFWPT